MPSTPTEPDYLVGHVQEALAHDPRVNELDVQVTVEEPLLANTTEPAPFSVSAMVGLSASATTPETSVLMVTVHVFPSVDFLREWFGVDSAIFVTTKDVLVVGATIPLMLALNYFVTRTRWGKAMRATAQDRETAQAMGINVERTILLTFFVGGALAGAAGLIQGLYYNIGMWWMGYQAGLRAFTAAVLGGIGNMPGAALGGLFIGFLSAWSDQYISARWTNAIVFSILILVLVFRPQGLLGARSADKV